MLLKTKHLKLCPRSLTSLHRLLEIASIHVIGQFTVPTAAGVLIDPLIQENHGKLFLFAENYWHELPESKQGDKHVFSVEVNV